MFLVVSSLVFVYVSKMTQTCVDFSDAEGMVNF